jgi:hypothetical protein
VTSSSTCQLQEFSPGVKQQAWRVNRGYYIDTIEEALQEQASSSSTNDKAQLAARLEQ